MQENEENIPDNNEPVPERSKDMIIIGSGGVGRTFSTEAAIKQAMGDGEKVIVIGQDAEKFLRSGPLLIEDDMHMSAAMALKIAEFGTADLGAGIIVVDDIEKYFAKEQKREFKYQAPPMQQAEYTFYEEDKAKKKKRKCSNSKTKKRKKAKNGKSGRK
jgi:hypothetical protein